MTVRILRNAHDQSRALIVTLESLGIRLMDINVEVRPGRLYVMDDDTIRGHFERTGYEAMPLHRTHTFEARLDLSAVMLDGDKARAFLDAVRRDVPLRRYHVGGR